MARKTEPTKKPARNSTRRWGIKNHLGGIWTPETFRSEDEAKAYLKGRNEVFGGDLKKHKVVPVRVTVSIIASGARIR